MLMKIATSQKTDDRACETQQIRVHLAKEKTIEVKPGGNANTLTVGAPGTGKTYSNLIPDILDNDGASLIIDDKKGQLHKMLAEPLQQKGYEVYKYDLINYAGNFSYNPFQTVTCREDLMCMAEFLIPDRNEKDPFWEQSARDLFVAVAEVGWKEFGSVMSFKRLMDLVDTINRDKGESGDPKTLKAVTEWVHQCERYSTEGYHCDDGVLELICKHVGRGMNYVGIKKYLAVRSCADDTFRSIVITLESALMAYSSRKLQRCMMSTPVDFREFGKRKIALFIANPDSDSKYAPVISYMYKDIYNVLVRCADEEYQDAGGMLPVHVRYILDDFCSGIRVPDFQTQLANCRSRNISFLIAIQDINQLQASYGTADAGSILACMKYHTYYRTKNPSTVSLMSRISGRPEEQICQMREDQVYAWITGNAQLCRRYPTNDLLDGYRRKDHAQSK